MKNSKNEIVRRLASFGLAAAYAKAQKTAKDKGQELTAVNGRKLGLDIFIEFLGSEDEIKTIPEMVELFLTFPKKHAFEEAAEKRAEKKAVLDAIDEEFGFSNL